MRDYKIGTMTTDVEAVGTRLKLAKGDRVKVYDATNLPDDSEFKYFVAPVRARAFWSDCSIAIGNDDVVIQ